MYEDIIQKLRVEGDATSAIKALIELRDAQDAVTKAMKAAQAEQASLANLGASARAQILAQSTSAKDLADAVKKLSDAQKTYGQETAQTTSHVQKFSNAFETAGKAMLGFGAAGFALKQVYDTIDHGTRAFGTMERSMQRVQHETQQFNQSATQMASQFHDIASRTGQNFEALSAGFRSLVATTGLSGDQAKQVFADIAVASSLAGVNVGTMAKLASAAINNLKVPLTEVGSLVLTMGQNMRGATGDFAGALDDITMKLSRVGIGGAKVGEDLSKMARSFSELGIKGNDMAAMFDKLTSFDARRLLGGNSAQEMVAQGKTMYDVVEKMMTQLEEWQAFDPAKPKEFLTDMVGGSDEVANAVHKLHLKQRESGLSMRDWIKSIKDARAEQRAWEASIAGMITKFDEVKKKLWEAFGEEISPTVSTYLKTLTYILDSLAEKEPIDWDYVLGTQGLRATIDSINTFLKPLSDLLNFLNLGGQQAGAAVGGALRGGTPTNILPPAMAEKMSYRPGGTEEQAMWQRISAKVAGGGGGGGGGGSGAAFTPGVGEDATTASARVTMAGLYGGGAYGGGGGGGGVRQASLGGPSGGYGGGGGGGSGRRGGGGGGDGATPAAAPAAASGGPDLGGTGTAKVGATGPEFTPGGPAAGGAQGGAQGVAGNASEAYKKIYDMAVKAGSPDPHMTAAIAMHESAGLTKGVFVSSGGTNPFGQTVKPGQEGYEGGVIGKDKQMHARYKDLEAGVADHVRRWGKYYGKTPDETVSNLVRRGYNTANPEWRAGVLQQQRRGAAASAAPATEGGGTAPGGGAYPQDFPRRQGISEAVSQTLAYANQVAPNRSRRDDGTIGDAAHARRVSDHNPDKQGNVNAVDLTHDPKGGFDAHAYAEGLRQQAKAGQDPRVKYIISNGRIASSINNWEWRKYTGDNPHDKHAHISYHSGARATRGNAPGNQAPGSGTRPASTTTAAPAAPGAGAASAPGAGGVPIDDTMASRQAGLSEVRADMEAQGLTITSGYRDPSHKLSRKYPGSYHTKNLAFDTRAKNTAQADAAIAKIKAQMTARGLVEGRDYKIRDEVRHPSGHATGPHIHTQFTPEGAKRYRQAVAKERGAAPAPGAGPQQDVDTGEGGLGKGVAFEPKDDDIGGAALEGYKRGPQKVGGAAQEAYAAGRKRDETFDIDTPPPMRRSGGGFRQRDITMKLPDTKKFRDELKKPIEIDAKPGPNLRRNSANERRFRRMESNDASLADRHKAHGDLSMTA